MSPPKKNKKSIKRLAIDPDALRDVVFSKRFLAADRAKLDLGEIVTWDPYLLREHRLLVPIDVQALYVEQGSTEAMVRLPMLHAMVNGKVIEEANDVESAMPDPFDPGSTRARRGSSALGDAGRVVARRARNRKPMLPQID